MRWGKLIYPLLLVLLGCLPTPNGLAAPVTYSFLPIVHESSLILLKAQGQKGIAVEIYSELLGNDIDQNLRDIRWSKTVPTRTIYLSRRVIRSERIYEASERPVRVIDNPLLFTGIQKNDDHIFISHTGGIDEVSLEEILRASSALNDGDKSQNDQLTIPVLTHHPLPNATGIVFLNGLFCNDLRLTSQWDAEKKVSVLSLVLDDAQWTKINEWEVNFPIFGMSLESFDPQKSSLNLFLAGGDTGLHTFSIHLEESTIHPNFIERKENLDPWSSPSSNITGVWSSEKYAHYAASDEAFTSFQDVSIYDLERQGHFVHEQRLKQFGESRYYTTHRNRAFKNGLLASWPFDADKIEDWLGFDLDKDLDQQLQAMGLYLSAEERARFDQSFRNWRLGGELTGDAMLILSLSAANWYSRHLKYKQTVKNIEDINRIREQFKIGQSQISIREGSNWLSQWKSEELWVSDTTAFSSQLSRLLATRALTAEKTAELIQAVEKRKFYIRPIERVLTSMGFALPIVQKLENWNLKRIQKFLNWCDPKDLEKLWLSAQSTMEVSVPFVNDMNRLRTLQNLEELSDIQKVEQFKILLRVKVELLQTIHKGYLNPHIPVAPKTTNALDWLWNQTGVPKKDFAELLTQSRLASDFLDQAEKSFRLSRLMELNRAGHELTNIEKIEKMKLLVESGWTGQGAEALSQVEKTKLITRLDEIYDFEHMRQSRYLDRLMTKGNLKQSALFTAYSDAANMGIEVWLRDRDGRPLFSTTTAHNVLWNTWIMVPIFLSGGLRTGKAGKVFLFAFNAANSSYFGQKLGKWGGDVFETEEIANRWNNWDFFFVPQPTMPLSEVPGYLMRDMFIHKDPTFDSKWALFDAGWCLILSTPRGYGVTVLSRHLGSHPALDKDLKLFSALRQGVRSSPVLVNETVGAATYTIAYPHFFDDLNFQLKILNSQFECLDPWQSQQWNNKPQIKLSLGIFSSTKPEQIRFELHRDASHVKYYELPETAWTEIQEQFYELTWTQDIDVTDHPSLYEIQNIQIKNKGRWASSSMNPFSEKEHEDGKELTLEKPLTLIIQAKDPFVLGLFKSLLALSKEASTEFYKGHKYYAAGIAYMIGQYLKPFYDENRDDEKNLVIRSQSNSLAFDALKEAKKITHSVQFSDYPITKEALDLLTEYLDTIAHHALPEGTLAMQDIQNPRTWLDQETLKRLSSIRADILEETLFLTKATKSTGPHLIYIKDTPMHSPNYTDGIIPIFARMFPIVFRI